MTVWLLTDGAMDVHRSPGHPERPERRSATADGVRDAASDAAMELLEPALEEVTDDLVHLVHEPDYITLLGAADSRGAWLDPDTYVVPGSLRAARLAAGATVQAAHGVASGAAEVAFAVVRPPGHHAADDRGSGFCLLNNVAIAAEALRRDAGIRRVAVVDWDVHHGDGTQEIFDGDAETFYASTHQFPFYPGTGAPTEAGLGDAVGTKHNVPLAAGAGDADFVGAWRDRLLPALEAFGPEAILVSAGYDAHRDDPLAELEVTDAGYREVARLLGALSARLRLPGVALTLEGGYDAAALRRCAAATVRGLLEGRGGA